MKRTRWQQISAIAVTAVTSALSLTWGQAAAPAGLHPVVLTYPSSNSEALSMVLGAWENGQWLTTKKFAARFPQTAQWRMQTLSGQSQLVRSPAPLQLEGLPCEDTGFLTLPPSPTPGQYALATSPALNTRPRPVDVLPNNQVAYRNIVKTELVKRGLPNPVVNITRIVRTDLDGNGTQEILLEASHFTQDGPPYAPPPHASKGDYSILIFRWVKNGVAQTTVLGDSIFPRDEKTDGSEWLMPSLFEIGGVADLNGDGRMEIIAVGSYYEGSSASIFEWTPTTGLQERLTEGCGV